MNFEDYMKKVRAMPHYRFGQEIVLTENQAREMWNAATKAERERCAQIACEHGDFYNDLLDGDENEVKQKIHLLAARNSGWTISNEIQGDEVVGSPIRRWEHK